MARSSITKAKAAETVLAGVESILTGDPVLTVADVRKGGIDVRGTMQRILEREQVIAVAGTPVMTEKALHVFYATTTKGIISKDGGEFPTQGDYAAAFNLSPAYATRLKRLGRALVEFGVKQGDRRYTYLATVGDKKPAGEVFKAVDALPVTDDAKADAKARTDLFHKGIDALIAGKPAIEEKRGAQPDDGSKGGEDGGEDKGGEETTTARPVTVADVLSLLDTFAKEADREQWAAIENKLQAIITRENTVRAKAASK